ncbi:(2Fe-2S) ferredoxin domain-containing protein [Phosphitispora sp. TUW77]|uniref:(2Fe-2S) ferredoxin domain-containing protein n=1 Tax=Phosphitispora sp. TUW77 TaxID=3152361 RepID=UPI003AB4AA04
MYTIHRGVEAKMTLQDLEQIKKNVLSEHAMTGERKKVRITVGMGTCGIRAGAYDVLKVLITQFEDCRDVVIKHTGCLGMCSSEPVVQVAIPGRPTAVYFYMTTDKAGWVAARVSDVLK